VTFLIGQLTALVGDPSDKNKARPILTEEQVNDNATTYAEQAFHVSDRSKTIVATTESGLSKLSLVDLIRLGQNFTGTATSWRVRISPNAWSGRTDLSARRHSMH